MTGRAGLTGLTGLAFAKASAGARTGPAFAEAPAAALCAMADNSAGKLASLGGPGSLVLNKIVL